MLTHPAVFAVGENYQIMVPVENKSLFWIKIGKKHYYDCSNGVMCSMSRVHRVTVPMKVLDKAKSYTVCEKELIERKPYFPTSRETVETKYKFYPVPSGKVRAYMIADTHNNISQPVDAALKFGKIDFLILNGDIPDHSGSAENFDTIYKIASSVTKGEIPIVFARGNHDLRGLYAEKINEYIPNDNGNTYYTFRLNGIWGIVLDCGEDKDDTNAEYGGTVCCHSFREKETEFIKSVIEDKEYSDKSIKTRIIVVHNPFVHCNVPPFDIEKNIYGKWAKLLRKNIKPDLMLCGHLHTLEYHNTEDDWNTNGAICPVVVGSKPDKDTFFGTGIVFEKKNIKILFNDSNGNTEKVNI